MGERERPTERVRLQLSPATAAARRCGYGQSEFETQLMLARLWRFVAPWLRVPQSVLGGKTDGNKVWNRGFVLPQRRGAQYGLRSGRKLPKASAIPKRSKARYKMRRRKRA